MYDYSKLLGRMKELDLSQEKIADMIHISSTTLNKKLNNNSQFKQDEMLAIAKVLNISKDELNNYFFTHNL